MRRRDRMFVRLTIAGLLVLGDRAGAQVVTSIRPIRFERSEVEPHLPQSSVYAIHQDRRGFLWFGTREGLGRWDGYEMRTWKATAFRSDALPGNLVRRILEDRDGNLWVWAQPTDRLPFQIARLVGPGHDRVETFSLLHPVPFLDRQGRPWVVDRDSIRRFDGRGFPAVRSRIAQGPVHDAIMDRNEVIWVSTTGGQVERYAPGGAATIVPKSPATADPSSAAYSSFFEDDRGTLWLTGIGLARLDEAHNRIAGFPTSSARLDTAITTRILQDPEGWLWVASLDGVYRADPSFTTIEHHSLELPGKPVVGNFVLALTRDRSGAFWAGTPWGLHRYDPAVDVFGFLGHDPTRPTSLSSGLVMSIHQTTPDQLLVGTLGGGLNLVDRRTGAVRRLRHREGERRSLPHDWVWNIEAAAGGRVWIGLATGLALVDPMNGTVLQEIVLPAPSPGWTPAVLGLLADRNGGLWIGAGGQVWHRSTSGALRRYELPAAAEIQQFLEDGDRLWIATSAGLALLEPMTGLVRMFRHDPASPGSLNNDVVLSLHRDRAGRLWVGTSGGLNRLEPDSGFTHFGVAEQFPSSVIYAILQDEDGALWLSTNRGLVRFNPDAPAATGVRIFAGPSLGNVEFNRHAAFRGRDGTLYFGGDRGVTYFHPAALKDNPYRPPVVITALHRANQRGTQVDRYVDDQRPIRLNRDDYTVSFELAALSFTDPSRNQFEYRLAGFRDAWVKAGTSHRVSFTNLPPGHYVFQVRGSNEDGAWNEAGLSVPVVVPPWFWETWWFRVLAGLAAVGLVSAGTSFVLRTRHRLQLEAERQRHALEQERSRISRDMHDEVGASLTEIAVLSERTLREERGNGGTDHLRRIGMRSRETLASIGEIVWAINPDNDRLDRVAAYFREYSSAFLESAGLTGRLDFEPAPGDVPLSAEQRRHLFLVLKEALANAVTHAGASRVDVTLAVQGQRLRLNVRDDGIGFTPGAPGGPIEGKDGLGNMQRRADELGATLRIESAPGRGTEVLVELPL